MKYVANFSTDLNFIFLLQRSVDQADADMYRELYQRNQSLQKQLLEAKEVSYRSVLARHVSCTPLIIFVNNNGTLKNTN